MVFHAETLDGILPTLNVVSSDNAVGTIRWRAATAVLTFLFGKRTKAVPPVPYRLMTRRRPIRGAGPRPAQGEWKSNIQHHRKTDDLGRRLEVFEMVFHSEAQDGILPTLNVVSFDNAVEGTRSSGRNGLRDCWPKSHSDKGENGEMLQ